MACAKKCDRCGKLYDEYNFKKDEKNPNGVMTLNLDYQRKFYSHTAMDLCPDYMKEFQDWMEEVKKMTDNKPTLEIDREKNEVTIKCNGDTIKFKDDNVEVTRASKNMMFKLPDITPQLAISAFAVLHQYCSSISPHDCIRCTFYEHCPKCFMGCPGDRGETIRKLQSNE